MDPAFYSNQLDQLFQAVAKGPWRRIGIIAHVPTPQVSEPGADNLIDQCRQVVGERVAAMLHFDPNFIEPAWRGLPCMMASRLASGMFDAVVLLSPGFSEVLFHFFNQSPVRRLPLFAPFIAARPHRLFLRRRVFELLECRPFARVLEIGAIEHMGGGHRTTQALAEALGHDGSIVTIDRNPLSLELSRYYCRGLPTPLTTLCGDLWQLLRNPPGALQEHRFDLVLIHHASDNGGDETLPKLFEQMRPLLSPDAWLIFQSLHEWQPRAGSLQERLLENDYGLGVMHIENAVDVTRFLVIAKPRPRNGVSPSS